MSADPAAFPSAVKLQPSLCHLHICMSSSRNKLPNTRWKRANCAPELVIKREVSTCSWQALPLCHIHVPSGATEENSVEKIRRLKAHIWFKILHLESLFKATFPKESLQPHKTVYMLTESHYVYLTWPKAPYACLSGQINPIYSQRCIPLSLFDIWSKWIGVIFSATYWNEVVVQQSGSTAVVPHKCCMCRLITAL